MQRKMKIRNAREKESDKKKKSKYPMWEKSETRKNETKKKNQVQIVLI